MASLYELTQDVMYLQELLESGEIDENVFEDSIESLCVDDKLENICKMMRNLEYKAKAFKEEEDRMKARRRTLENGIQRLKDSMLAYMVTADRKKAECGLFTVSVGSSKSVYVWDESQLPEKFLVHQPDKVDKTAISKALKEGELVAGAEFVENPFLTVR